MTFVIRALLYAVCLFLVMIVYTGQKHETAADTLAWARTRPDDHAWRGGVTRDVEKRALGL